MHQNIAVAQEMILSCFRFDGRRNKVVYADRNFPSDQYIYEARAAHGARLVRVGPAADGIATDGEQVAAAIDDETLLVAIDHVMFRSSAITDVEPIVAKARKHGAFVVLDVFHSGGIVPLAPTSPARSCRASPAGRRTSSRSRSRPRARTTATTASASPPARRTCRRCTPARRASPRSPR
jgi:hypothetical protein